MKLRIKKINEIIIRDLGNLFKKYNHWGNAFREADISEREFKNRMEEIKSDFASTLLSKLQILNKDNIEKILIQTSAIEELELKSGAKITYRVIGQAGFKNIIDRIHSLIPDIDWYYKLVLNLLKKHSIKDKKFRERIKELKADMDIYEGFIKEEKLEKIYQKYIDDNIENII